MGTGTRGGSNKGSGKFKVLFPDDSGERRKEFSSLLSQSISLKGNGVPGFSGSYSEAGFEIEELSRGIKILGVSFREVLVKESFKFSCSEDVSRDGLGRRREGTFLMEENGDGRMVRNASLEQSGRGGTREGFDRDEREEPGGEGGVDTVKTE